MDGKEGVPLKITPPEGQKLEVQWTSDKGILIQVSEFEVQWLALDTSGQAIEGPVQVSVLLTNEKKEQRKINFFLESNAEGKVTFSGQTEGSEPLKKST